MSRYSSVLNSKVADVPHRRATEATATAALQKRLYFGVGDKFLGYHFADQVLQDDGSLKKIGDDGYRHWNVPSDEVARRRWRPVFEHLKGLPRGLVALGSSHVPCITTDFDRHVATVDPVDHVRRVVKAGRLLRSYFPQLCWLAEVNPKNGSMKFFGFGTGPIEIGEAQKVAEQVHELLLRHGCGAVNRHGKPEVEVFPYNCVQVGLPMRADKTTIMGTGILPKCVRRRKRADGCMEDFEAYSALAFLTFLQEHVSYDEKTLIPELVEACGRLPFVPTTKHRGAPVPPSVPVKEPEMMVISTNAPLGPICTRVPVRRGTDQPRVAAQSDYRSDLNSYQRQQGALLDLCRKLGRVATVEEGLEFIRSNGLFSGEWSQNEARRRHRVTYLLNRIAKTFDSDKCSSRNRDHSKTVNVGKYDNWARTFAGTVQGVNKHVNEQGNVVELRGVAVGWQWISVALSVIEYCCVTCPNDDASLPQRRAEEIWTCLQDAKRVSSKWDDRKWKTARDWLERKGIIRIVDRNWRFGHGKGTAMKWAVNECFHQLHVWWKRVKTALGNAAVSLSEFLKKQRHCPPLNSYTHSVVSKTKSGPCLSPDDVSRGPPGRQQ